MIFDRILAPACHENNTFDPRSDAFLHRVLNQRLIDNRKHFLRLRLRGGQKSRAKPCYRQNRFAHAFSL